MVPNGWSFGRVDNFFILQRGFDLTNKKRVEGTIPVYSSSGLAYYHNEVKVKGPGIVTGRKGSVGKVFMIEEDFWPHDTTLWVKDFKANDILYIKYFLDALKLERFDEASSVPTLNRNNVHRVQTVFPPLPEQRKIAKILSTWDRSIATTEKLIDASKQQKKALMQQLLTGKKRLVDPETGKAFEGEWEEVKLSQLVKVTGGNAFKSEQFATQGIPLIKISNIKADYSVNVDSSAFIAEESKYEKFKVKTGDVLIAMSGATTGKVGCYRFDDFSYLNQRVGRFDPKKNKVTKPYLFQLLKLPKVQHDILIDAVGGAQPNISNKDIERLKVKVPVIGEQQKIASVLTVADKEIELLEAKLAHLKQEKKALMQQLLTGKRRVSLSS
ncbi:restriction endonuclease subunit S [Photobacterium toruni]|uniref:EcoKI restriction-modification system protein HsdS n=1 Tax=Photobacterium toruni TaxID=1935446 RepID=A0A1T4TU01_9GAMM|nr:restriction endonuclease subunit S [Photobacterium toruni]SKA43943.1 EcoKI restriction-modification system protein HsdS [Photobacterium toruni]